MKLCVERLCFLSKNKSVFAIRKPRFFAKNKGVLLHFQNFFCFRFYTACNWCRKRFAPHPRRRPRTRSSPKPRTQMLRTQQFEGSKKEHSSAAKAADSSQRKWKMEAGSAWRSLQGKMELRSPDGTEPERAVGVARVAVAAPRATAEAGADVPVAAAQQTKRTSRRSCGVCLRRA